MISGRGDMEFGSNFEQRACGELITFARFYQALCGSRQVPHRDDFHPSDVPWIAGRLYTVDVLEGGADYRFHSWGIYLKAVFGADLSNRKLSDIELAGRLELTRSDLDAVVSGKCPVFRTGLLVWPNHQTLGFERVMVPFCDNFGNVSLILSVFHGDKPVHEMMLMRGIGIPQVLLDAPATPALVEVAAAR